MRIQFSHTFEEIISIKNLLDAWREFLRGKRKKRDVQEFGLRLMDNVFTLHDDLVSGKYQHGGYQAFNIFDPKPRRIHKASVRDRLLHHAIYRVLYPFFDRTFIADSYSCRLGKGTHAALDQFRAYAYQVSCNHTRTCWVLKCDIRKFFANVDHGVLLHILRGYIPDRRILCLLDEVIRSHTTDDACDKGLPLGNLTSQLFANVYLNELDQFVKHKIKARFYIRYADDFVILSEDRNLLEQLIPHIRDFLHRELKLELHPRKVSIGTFASGVDFLGWVHFSGHRVLRTTTKRRMMKKVAKAEEPEVMYSYLGLLCHGNAYKLRENIEELYARTARG